VKVQPLFLITTVTLVAQLGFLPGSRRLPQRPAQPSQVRRRGSFPLDGTGSKNVAGTPPAYQREFLVVSHSRRLPHALPCVLAP